MSGEWDELVRAVREAGYLTSFRRLPLEGFDGHCLICVNGREEPRGLVGRSFQVWRALDGTWVLGTWAPREYRIPEGGAVADVCIDLLRCIGP